MLPYNLINFLRTHIDNATQTRFNYACHRMDQSEINVRMFWNVIESDTIVDIVSAPYTDLQQWFNSFCASIRHPTFADPVIKIRNHIKDHELQFAADASHIVSTQIELLRSTRMTDIREKFHLTPPHSPTTVDSPLTNMEQRLRAFHNSISGTPQRQSPLLRPRANRQVHDMVTEQYDIALLSPYGTAFHTRDATYLRRQEFLFRANMAEHLARFGETPTTDYSLIVPPTLVSRSLIPHYSLPEDVLPPRQLSPFSRGIILAHESQQQIQRDHITSTGATSNAAATILAMNAQSVLDAACSISGSSSRHPHASHTGILSRTVPLPATAATINHPPPKPKPLNFGLDRREQAMLQRQNLAVEAMQDASTIPISATNARNMLLAADQARTTSWLNLPIESDYEDCSLLSTQPHAPATTPRVLRTPLEFYTAVAPNDPLAEDPFTYGTSTQPNSPRPLMYTRVSDANVLSQLQELNNPPPAHCTRSKSNSHDSNRD
jgi:hypothetical protein